MISFVLNVNLNLMSIHLPENAFLRGICNMYLRVYFCVHDPANIKLIYFNIENLYYKNVCEVFLHIRFAYSGWIFFAFWIFILHIEFRVDLLNKE